MKLAEELVDNFDHLPRVPTRRYLWVCLGDGPDERLGKFRFLKLCKSVGRLSTQSSSGGWCDCVVMMEAVVSSYVGGGSSIEDGRDRMEVVPTVDTDVPDVSEDPAAPDELEDERCVRGLDVLVKCEVLGEVETDRFGTASSERCRFCGNLNHLYE